MAHTFKQKVRTPAEQCKESADWIDSAAGLLKRGMESAAAPELADRRREIELAVVNLRGIENLLRGKKEQIEREAREAAEERERPAA